MRTRPDERTAPDVASGAVSSLVTAKPVPAIAFWRAVGAEVLATLRPWSR